MSCHSLRAGEDLDNVADGAWLASEQARPWLELAGQSAATNPIALDKALRRSLSPERARWIVEQTTLRHRGATKFRRAKQMLFTRKGLEQATDDRVAQYKSERFAAAPRIADLCCGIGGDLMALGQVAVVTGVDRDRLSCRFAAHNADVVDARAELICADVAGVRVDEFDAWHIDPDRRAAGRRAAQWSDFQPDRRQVERLLMQNATAALKTAPVTDIPDGWRQEAEREWISARGECRQQVVWFGDLARCPGQHRAVVLDPDGGTTPSCIVGDPQTAVAEVERPGPYVYEPQAAVYAAQLTAALARQYGLQLLGHRHGYLTGSNPLQSPLWQAFQVIDVLPLDRRQVKRWLRDHHIGSLEVKVRRAQVDPVAVRRWAQEAGHEHATVLVTTVRRSTVAIIARRCGDGDPPR